MKKKKVPTIKEQLINIRKENRKLQRDFEIQIYDIKQELAGIGSLLKRFNEIFTLHSTSFNQKLDSHFNIFCREALNTHKSKEINQWIPVEQELPKEKENVLIIVKSTLLDEKYSLERMTGYMKILKKNKIIKWFSNEGTIYDNWQLVTHWMPVPKFPITELAK